MERNLAIKQRRLINGRVWVPTFRAEHLGCNSRLACQVHTQFGSSAGSNDPAASFYEQLCVTISSEPVTKENANSKRDWALPAVAWPHLI